MAKKTTRRDKIKHPMLEKRFNSRVKQEQLDADYLHKLSEEELDWYNKFLNEFVNASFSDDGTDLHTEPEHRKERYDANNARHRCLYGRIRNKVGHTKLINYDLIKNVVEEELGKDATADAVEDAVISLIDYIKSKER